MKMQGFLAGRQKVEKQIVMIIAGAVAVLLTAVCGTWEGPPPRVPKIHPPQSPMIQEIYSVVLSALSPDGRLVAGANYESSTIKISKAPDNQDSRGGSEPRLSNPGKVQGRICAGQQPPGFHMLGPSDGCVGLQELYGRVSSCMAGRTRHSAWVEQ
jgi:hypothetical protein